MFPSHKLRCYEDSCTCRPGYVYQEFSSLNYQQNDLIIKHIHLPLYWTASPNGCINFRPSNESSKEGEGVTITFCNSIISFVNSSSFPWWVSLSQIRLLRFSNDGSQMRKRMSRNASSIPDLVVLPGYCSPAMTSGFFWEPSLVTQKSHVQTGPETVHLSTRAHWCSSLRQTPGKAPQEKLREPFLSMWWYTSQIAKGWGNYGHAEWAFTKGQAKQTLPALSSHPRAKRDPHFIDGGSDKEFTRDHKAGWLQSQTLAKQLILTLEPTSLLHFKYQLR